MVIWIIGMSGAGKSTIGRELYALWKPHAANTVLVDGDQVRAIFGQDRSPLDYTVEGRRKNAERIYEMCLWLDRQGINVVCCLLSIFPDVQACARQNYSSYFEVFVDVPLDILARRDDKGIYSPALTGTARNVVGVDIPFPPPPKADLVLDNSGFDTPPARFAGEIARRAKLIGPDGAMQPHAG